MTYPHQVLTALEAEPAREAFVLGDRRLTRGQARAVLIRLANALLDRGLRPGDGVGLFVGNRPESVLLTVAVHLVGCRVVFIPPEPGATELAGLVRRSQVALVVIDSTFDPRGTDLGGLELDELLASGRTAEPEWPASPLEVTTVFYTGGTTGQPKLPTHGGGVYRRLSETAALTPAVEGRFLVCTLVTHVSGHVLGLMALLCGWTVVLMERFDAQEAVATINRERIGGTLFVTPMLYAVLDDPTPMPTLGAITVGGAPLSPARLRQAVERFGPVVRQTYAMSEALGVTGMDPADVDLDRPETLRSCGKALPGVLLEIRDEEGRVLPAGEVGDVHVSGDSVMRGYWGEPPLVGWLNTGDVGYLDADGFLYLVDRSKDVIVTGTTADNVYSRLLDDFLVTLPGIRLAAAVGERLDDEREAVHVFVVPDNGQPVDTEEITRAVVAELGDLYRPRAVTVVADLPLTAIGKVDKKALRSRLK